MRRTRIASRSPAKAEADAKYRCAKVEHFREHPDCAFPWCRRSLTRGDEMDLHHAAGRNGPLLYAKQFFRTLCRQHHDFVENNLSWSRTHGWIIDLTVEEVRKLRLDELLIRNVHE